MTMLALQQIAWDWGVRCFGSKHMNDVSVRSLRLAEEAVELAQACGVPKSQMLELVEIVYKRPEGSKIQELGGVLVTTTVLCEALGKTAEEVMLREVRRCLEKTPEHFAQRNTEKIQLGLTGQ